MNNQGGPMNLRYFHHAIPDDGSTPMIEYTKEGIEKVWAEYGDGEIVLNTDTNQIGYAMCGGNYSWYGNPFPDDLIKSVTAVADRIERELAGDFGDDEGD